MSRNNHGFHLLDAASRTVAIPKAGLNHRVPGYQ
jgi:hypothetical protein